jgi:hypothetical protein
MTRSHMLLRCQNSRLAEAREGRDPGGVRVLLTNPRWEKKLLRLRELAGVGRVVSDGSDEDGVWAPKMDSRIVSEAEEEAVRGWRTYPSLTFYFFLSFHTFMLGGLIPRRCAHRARMMVKDFLCCDLRQGPRLVSSVPLFSVVYIPLRGERLYTRRIHSFNQSCWDKLKHLLPTLARIRCLLEGGLCGR